MRRSPAVVVLSLLVLVSPGEVRTQEKPNPFDGRARQVTEARPRFPPAAACKASCEGPFQEWTRAAAEHDATSKRVTALAEERKRLGVEFDIAERLVNEGPKDEKSQTALRAARNGARDALGDAAVELERADQANRQAYRKAQAARDAYLECCGEAGFGLPWWTYVATAGGVGVAVANIAGDPAPDTITPPVVAAEPQATGNPTAQPQPPQPNPMPAPPVAFTGSLSSVTVSHPTPGVPPSIICGLYATTPPMPFAGYVIVVTGPLLSAGQNLSGTLNANGQAAIQARIETGGPFLLMITTTTAAGTQNSTQFSGVVGQASSPCPTLPASF